jgi:hypothetical protein
VDKLVPHPRFRHGPQGTPLEVTEQEVRKSHWKYHDAHIFPQTALRADVGMQNYSVYPRPFYVDIQRTCLDCRRDFIFFALEQRYWYETRGFYVDSDCVRCVQCRHKRRVAKRIEKRHHQSYTELQARASLSREEMIQLVDACIFLFQQGMLKKPSRLERIKSAAMRLVPEYPKLKTLERLLLAAHDARTIDDLSG